jgi:hypothetical protein
MTRTSDREAAYMAIDSERDYQDAKWGSTLSSGRKVEGTRGYRPLAGGDRSIDEFALYIQRYANALTEVCGTSGRATSSNRRTAGGGARPRQPCSRSEQ